MAESRDQGPVHVTTWFLIPAVVMSLGWGLRGYIGGGPFGAMIPGVLVGLMLCQFLRIEAKSAVLIVAFATIGIGLGGNMTYGQTLGLIRVDETFWWGLTGTTTKGAVWGLLGGAMMGLGFVARYLSCRSLAVALGCVLAGAAVGIHLINVPRLIYFSDPVDKPRDESWAGLLLAAVALLAWIRIFQPRFSGIAMTMACGGAISGGLGFGLGSLFLYFQAQVSDHWSWLPFWKFMEFSFGFMLGGGLGLGTWKLRSPLQELNQSTGVSSATDNRPGSLFDWILAGGTVIFVFFGWPYVARLLLPQLDELARNGWAMTIADVLADFSGVGCVFLLCARRWPVIGWQLAISVTIVAAAVDWVRDLEPRGGINMPDVYRQIFVWGMALVSVIFVQWWQRQKPPALMSLFLFAICCLMGIGYMMGLGWSDIWWGNPEAQAAAGGRMPYLWQKFRSEVIVHAIFTTLFVWSVLAAVRQRRMVRA